MFTVAGWPRPGPHRTRRLRGWCASLALGAALLVAGCDSGGGSEGKLTEARTAWMRGDLDRAEALFLEVQEAEPDNVQALVGLADIYLDRNEIDKAAVQFARLEQVELSRRDETLVQQRRQRYLSVVLEQARGEGAANPADPEAYEEALIGLYNIDGDDELGAEIVLRLAYEARRALGAAEVTEPLSPDSDVIARATVEQLEAGRAAYERLAERDPRLTLVLNVPAEVRGEALGMVAALKEIIFERRFTARFESNVKAGLIEAERFVEESNVIRILFQDQYEGPRLTSDEEQAAFRDSIALPLIVGELGALTCEVQGGECLEIVPRVAFGRNEAEIVEFFVGYEVVNFEMARDGAYTIEITVPYALLTKTAYRLGEYREWLSTRPEGTGAGVAGGTGTGAPPGGTGTGAPPREGTGQ